MALEYYPKILPHSVSRILSQKFYPSVSRILPQNITPQCLQNLKAIHTRSALFESLLKHSLTQHYYERHFCTPHFTHLLYVLF
jgi:hypothetical protein